jgi:hypothetical protein
LNQIGASRERRMPVRRTCDKQPAQDRGSCVFLRNYPPVPNTGRLSSQFAGSACRGAGVNEPKYRSQTEDP